MKINKITNEGNTRIHAASVAFLRDDPRIFNYAYEKVSVERRKKTDRFRFEKDKCLSIGAELLLRHALSEFGLDYNDKDMEFDYGENGKPFLKDSNIYFNLSHSGEYVLCAISENEVGCDIEKITPISENIARKFFFRSEYSDIIAQPDIKSKNEQFYRYWTLKESFMKATGLGLKLSLCDFEIIIDDIISVVQSVDNRTYGFKEFDSVPGYKCALCTAGNCDNVMLKKTDLLRII